MFLKIWPMWRGQPGLQQHTLVTVSSNARDNHKTLQDVLFMGFMISTLFETNGNIRFQNYGTQANYNQADSSTTDDDGSILKINCANTIWISDNTNLL